MNGQLSIEFLMDFLILLAFIGLAAAALQHMETAAAGEHAKYSTVLGLEAEARALDVYYTFPPPGMSAPYTGDGMIDHGIQRETNGGWVAIPIMAGDGSHAEPV